MSLADELDAEPDRRKKRCGTCAWLNTQSDEDRASFNAWAMTANNVFAGHRVLHRRGYPLSCSSLANHIHRCVRESR